MSKDFKESLKVLSEEEKKLIYVDIITAMINLDKVPSKEKITERLKVTEGLSEDELTAIYEIALDVKKSIIAGREDDKLMEFLNINEYCKNDNGNLIKFVNATVDNIREERRNFPNVIWSFSQGKIFRRMEGKNPYKDIMEGKGSLDDGDDTKPTNPSDYLKIVR